MNQHDSLTVIQHDSKPVKFECSKCGACCKIAGKTGLMPDRGDGACIHLTQDNLCSIYETRPDLCNMEKMWQKRRFELDLDARGVTKKAYFKVNSEVCNQMMEQQGMDKKFLINLKVYDEMSDETEEKEEIQSKKPKIQESCPNCDSALVVTSIMPQNGQVNVACKNYECPGIGFILDGKAYYTSGKEK